MGWEKGVAASEWGEGDGREKVVERRWVGKKGWGLGRFNAMSIYEYGCAVI